MSYEKPEPGKPIILDVGGRQLEMRFSLRTLKALDAEHKISILRGHGMADAFQDPAQMAVVLYYGLREKNPDVTQDWVEDNMTAAMLLDLAPMLAFATTGRWPDVQKILDDANPQKPMEAGLISGQLEGTTLHVQKTNSGA